MQSPVKVSGYFENSDSENCPVTYSLTNTGNSALSNDMKKLIKINGTSNMIEVDPEEYTAGSNLEVLLVATTGF